MQLVGRLCESCGATTIEGADGCGACDVVVCAKCLSEAARCPSCQRPFDETRDAAPRADREEEVAIGRGRRQAIAIAVTVLGSVIVVGLLGGTPLAGVAMQAFVLGLLFVQLFRGRGWARWILLALIGLGAAANGFQAAHFDEGPWVLSLALALAFGWSALVLALSDPLSRYLRAQRALNP